MTMVLSLRGSMVPTMPAGTRGGLGISGLVEVRFVSLAPGARGLRREAGLSLVPCRVG